MTFPTERTARQAHRATTREQVLADTEIHLARVSRSMNCGNGLHTPCVGALQCICECHDEPREDA